MVLFKDSKRYAGSLHLIGEGMRMWGVYKTKTVGAISCYNGLDVFRRHFS
jgi:hypothetical protein